MQSPGGGNEISEVRRGLTVREKLLQGSEQGRDLHFKRIPRQLKKGLQGGRGADTVQLPLDGSQGQGDPGPLGGPLNASDCLVMAFTAPHGRGGVDTVPRTGPDDFPRANLA